tara:strand:+ start:332 stop:496 length:165 start_codon:yes stop_codon:yes gene_type:complete
MILNASSLSIQNNTKDIDNSSKKNPTLNDLMAEQNIIIKKAKTVHRRRDLDSLG